jgi:hypothetical protein
MVLTYAEQVFSAIHTSLVCVRKFALTRSSDEPAKKDTEIWRGLGDNVWNLSGVQQERIYLVFPHSCFTTSKLASD